MNTIVSNTSTSEARIACAVHIGAVVLALLTSWMVGLAGALGAGVILMLRPMGSQFVADHAREALNFNLSMFLYSLVALAFVFVTFGIGLIVVIPLALLFALVWLICSIKAAIAASDGRMYTYPMTLRLF